MISLLDFWPVFRHFIAESLRNELIFRFLDIFRDFRREPIYYSICDYFHGFETRKE